MSRQNFILKSGNKSLQLGQRTLLMGIVNLTPDSFYNGGQYLSPEAGIAHAERLLAEGADILDLGGQSTRPNSESVGTDEELRRILPVLKHLRHRGDCWISVDTYRAEVARICLEEGADMINDVSSFRMDSQMPAVVANAKIPVVCMHFLESIHPMPANPVYGDLFGEIRQFFNETIRIAERSGVNQDQIVLDPGIGFGKTLDHNISVIRNLSFLKSLGRPILAGPSRKSFIQKITGAPVQERLEGTAAAAAICILEGAHLLRVHDVQFFKRFCEVLDFIIK